MAAPSSADESAIAAARSSLFSIMKRAATLIGDGSPLPSIEAVGVQERQKISLLQRLRAAEFTADDSSLSTETSQTKLHWLFATACLNLLDNVNNVLLGQNATSSQVLGIRDLKLVHGLCETVVAWGILPNLSDGVGVPVDRRVRSGYSVALTNDVEFDPLSTPEVEAEGGLDLAERLPRLFSVMSKIMPWLLPPSVNVSVAIPADDAVAASLRCGVADLIFSRYLTDVYSALAQLSQGPIPSSSSAVQASISSVNSSSVDSPASVIGSTKQSSSFSSAEVELRHDNDLQKAHHIDHYNNNIFGPNERTTAATWLNSLFKLADPYLTLGALTTLLSATKVSARPAREPDVRWMQACCGSLLSQVSLMPNGIRILLNFMVGEEANEQDSSAVLKQLEGVSRLVLAVPGQAESLEQYFTSVCCQLLTILRQPQKDAGKGSYTSTTQQRIVQATTFTISRIIARHPKLAHKFIIRPIARSFWDWWGPASPSLATELSKPFDSAPLIHTTEEELESNLLCLSRLLLTTDQAPKLILASVRDCVPALYHLRDCARKSGSPCSRLAEDILGAYFAIGARTEVSDVLLKVAGLVRRPPWIPSANEHWRLDFERASAGGYQLVWQKAPSLEDDFFADPDALVAFIRDVIHGPDAAGDFFVSLLSEYAQLTSSAASPMYGARSKGKGIEVLSADDASVGSLGAARAASSISASMRNPKRMVALMNIIMAMTQVLGPTIVRRPTQILSVALSVLENCKTAEQVAHEKQRERERRRIASDAERTQRGGLERLVGGITSINVEDEDEDDGEVTGDENFGSGSDDETAILVMSLVSAVINENEKLSPSDSRLLDAIFHTLEKFDDGSSPLVRATASELRTVIAYRNAELLAKHQTKSGSEAERARADAWEKYEKATRMLADELLPVRAHGLATLRELVLKKSQILDDVIEIPDESDAIIGDRDGFVKRIRMLDRILDIFIRMVQEEDSYIYLNAIKCLSALTDTHGEKIIEKLGLLYRGQGIIGSSLDPRLRIGEALLQTVRRCGSALGKYVHVLVPPLYSILVLRDPPIKDKEEGNSASRELLHLKGSALSILAVACESCPHALTKYHHDIVDYACDVISLEGAGGDEGRSVRRAATVVLVLLIRGLGRDALYSFPTDLLRRSYRALLSAERNGTRGTRNTTSVPDQDDELMKYHARFGLLELKELIEGEFLRT